MKTAIYTYAAAMTLALLLVIVWRAGFHAGQADINAKLCEVLKEEARKPNLGGTWDHIARAMPDLEF